MRKFTIKEFKEFIKCLPIIWRGETKGIGSRLKAIVKSFFSPTSLQVFFIFTTATLILYKQWKIMILSSLCLFLSYIWKKYEEGKDRYIRKMKGEI